MCPGIGEYCFDTEGSYKCMCKANYFMEGGFCKEGEMEKMLVINIAFNLLLGKIAIY